MVVDALRFGFIKWNQIALLIIDECHHAIGGDPMAQLMRSYVDHDIDNEISSVSEIESKGLPKVLGLTATIINSGHLNASEIETDIKYIESRLCCRAYTSKNYDEVLK